MICGTIGNEIDRLDISAFPVNEKAKVDIVGNDNLVIGENTIKIIVTSENSKTLKTYTLKLQKNESNSLVDIGADNNTASKNNLRKESRFKDILSVMGTMLNENRVVLLLYALIWIEFLQVVYLYEKLKNFENKAGINEYNRIKEVNNNKEK